ncbi:hypothetical protein D3C79_882840 [compost metagenome]
MRLAGKAKEFDRCIAQRASTCIGVQVIQSLVDERGEGMLAYSGSALRVADAGIVIQAGSGRGIS